MPVLLGTCQLLHLLQNASKEGCWLFFTEAVMDIKVSTVNIPVQMTLTSIEMFFIYTKGWNDVVASQPKDRLKTTLVSWTRDCARDFENGFHSCVCRVSRLLCLSFLWVISTQSFPSRVRFFFLIWNLMRLPSITLPISCNLWAKWEEH